MNKRKFIMPQPTGQVCLALACFIAFGCAEARVTDPRRTATEQFMMTTAAARAVEQLSFDALRGRRVFVEDTYVDVPERAFLVAEVRARLLLEGLSLATQRDQAEIVLEIRSGGVGIDRNDSLLGIPAATLAGGGVLGATASGGVPAPPVSTTELALLKTRDQQGYAGVAYIAYWADTGEMIATSGPFIGRTRREDWWFFGSGPHTVGNIPPAEPEPTE